MCADTKNCACVERSNMSVSGLCDRQGGKPRRSTVVVVTARTVL